MSTMQKGAQKHILSTTVHLRFNILLNCPDPKRPLPRETVAMGCPHLEYPICDCVHLTEFLKTAYGNLQSFERKGVKRQVSSAREALKSR